MQLTEKERAHIVARLSTAAEVAHGLAALYEEAAETVAGFTTEEEYQDLAREAFEAQESSKDAWEMAQ